MIFLFKHNFTSSSFKLDIKPFVHHLHAPQSPAPGHAAVNGHHEVISHPAGHPVVISQPPVITASQAPFTQFGSHLVDLSGSSRLNLEQEEVNLGSAEILKVGFKIFDIRRILFFRQGSKGIRQWPVN